MKKKINLRLKAISEKETSKTVDASGGVARVKRRELQQNAVHYALARDALRQKSKNPFKGLSVKHLLLAPKIRNDNLSTRHTLEIFFYNPG
jgi:hypothetical protein